MVFKNKNVNEEVELGEDDDDFEDDSSSEFDEDEESNRLGDKDNFIDESFDDFETSIRNQPDVYRIWLDTTPQLKDLFLSLTNQELKRIKYVKNGKKFYKTKLVPISYKDKDGNVVKLKPLANERGVSQIMAFLKAFFNSAVVQGNLDKKEYHNEAFWQSERFICSMWTNRINWDIDVHNISQINVMVVGIIELFLTRLIGNLERTRERVNPNSVPSMNVEKGFVDKLAFWRKEKEGRA